MRAGEQVETEKRRQEMQARVVSLEARVTAAVQDSQVQKAPTATNPLET